MKTKLVLGFLFNKELNHVVLIVKKRPDWQAGKINGLGGHVDPLENPYDAMQREFMEECGAVVYPSQWEMNDMIVNDTCVVYVFCASDQDAYDKAHTTTDEDVVKVVVPSIHADVQKNMLHNVPVLICSALEHLTYEPTNKA